MKQSDSRQFWYSPAQFALVRFLLGLWIAITAIRLIPYAGELFTASGGIAPTSSANYLYGFFPDILYLTDSSDFVVLLLSAMAVLGVLFALGVYRALAAVLLWLGWATLFVHNPFTEDPSVAFIGWLLLAYAIIPHGEPYALYPKLKVGWRMPAIIYWGAWIVLGVAFTVSGIDRLASPSWIDGTAMYHLYNLQIARDWWLVDLLREQPMWLVRLQTWGSVAVFLLTLPALVTQITRKVWWFLLAAMFCFVHMTLSLTDVVIGMFIFYLFVFDSRWFADARGNKVIRYDDTCGICRRFVNYVKREDRQKQFMFIPLPVTKAAGTCVDSLELVDTNNQLYRSADAVLGIVAALGGLHAVALIGYLVPRAWRDRLYHMFGCRRHTISQFFGLR